MVILLVFMYLFFGFLGSYVRNRGGSEVDVFKFGFVEETRKGTLLKKGSLDPPKTFGARDYEADWWRTPTEIK